ncbi:MAG: cytochrome c biogenesis protein CcdA [Aquificae bacterium]|nr:cytochrome c biogenesis protein CcdA [Aquificota bacterium]
MEVTLLGAFIAGLLSFLSPCILPVVPAYLSYLSGATLTEKAPRTRAFLASLFFVLGFSAVFIALGASASLVGSLLREYQELILRLGSGFVAFFGLHFAGAFFWKHFTKAYAVAGLLILLAYSVGLINLRELAGLASAYALVLALYLLKFHELLYRQLKLEARASASYLGAFVIGTVFALGWSPCIGPVLASILLLASQQETVGRGALLLTAYAAGMGLPFLAAGLLFSSFVNFVKRFSRYFRWVELAGGLLLLALAVLLATGKLYLLTGWLVS